MSALRSAWYVLALGGCTYGPPTLQLNIGNHRFAPDAPQVAFAVRASWIRSPTGLSTWPDGGATRTLAEAGAVYVCDTLTLAIRRAWRVDRSDDIRSGFSFWLGPWRREGLYVSQRGYRTPTSEPGGFIRHNFLILPDDSIREVLTEPPLDHSPAAPAACAERVLAEAKQDPPAHSPH